MDLAAVMDQVGDQLDTITGLRVYRYPPDNVQVPAAVVTYPETYTFDETFGRGMDRMDLPVVVMVGKVSDRKSRDQLAAYTAGDGARSVKQTLESGVYTAFDTVRVADADFDIVRMANVDHVAATFTLDIGGQGSGVPAVLPGGIELDYAERIGDHLITGNPFLVFPIPDTTVVVPDVAQPVYLYGKAILVATAPGTGVATELAVDTAGQANVVLDQVLDATHGHGLSLGQGVTVMARLAPHSPGSYQLYATVNTGNVNVLSPSHATAKLAAIAYTGT